jgi:EmrB/QacA subfamily drug resistance transporter
MNANKRLIFFIIILSSFLTPFAASSMNIALPSIGTEFSMNAILLSWVPTAYILSSAAFLVPFGRLADMYGRERIFILGISVFSISALLCSISKSSLMLISFCAVEGIGAAMIFGTGLAILISSFPPAEKGKVLGVNVASVYIGASIGPFFGGLLTQHFSWRSIFVVNFVIGLIVAAFSLWKMRGRWENPKGEKFDFVGSVVFGLMLVSLMYGFSLVPEILGILFIAGGIIGIIFFVIWETRTTYPVLNVRIFKENLVFTFSNLAALINYSATFAVSFLLSLYLQHVKGLSPASAGIILVAQPIVQALFSPIAGRLSDRIAPAKIASIGMGFTAAGLFIFAFLHENTDNWFIVFTLMILGLGFALFSSPNTNAIMSSVEKSLYGVASAMVGTMRLIGQMFSMGVATIVFAVFLGKAKIENSNLHLLTASTRTAFLVMGILCILGIFASLVRGRLGRKEVVNQE